MAKVMISLPDRLLARVDAHAAEHGSSRSATIRDLAEAALGERERLLADRMRALEGHARGHGGDVAELLKRQRPAWIFLDASVLLATEDRDDSNHRAAATLLRSGGALATLELAAYEVTNIAERRWRDTAASRRLRERVWAIAELGALVRVDRRLAERVADLSREHRLSAYDAAYAAGAERLGAQLASCDERDLVSRGLARLPRELVARGEH